VTLRQGSASRLLLHGTMVYAQGITRIEFFLPPLIPPPAGEGEEEAQGREGEQGGPSAGPSTAEDLTYQLASRRRTGESGRKQEEEKRGQPTGEGPGQETTQPAPSPPPIVLVVDRPQNRLLVIFPSTRSWQELPLDRLDPLRDPLVLGIVAMGDEWVERWWKATRRELARLAEEGVEDVSQIPRLALRRLGRRAVGERPVEGYRIEVGERGEFVFFLDEETGLPLSMKARSGGTLLDFSTRGLSPRELDCSSLTSVPPEYEKLEARKGTDLLIVGLFQRLGLGLRTNLDR